MSRRDALWLALYAALVAGFLAPLLLAGQTLYFDDTHHWYYPIRWLLTDELRAGRLPLWTPLAGGGYPLLAEGQCGGLSPLTLVLAPLGMPAALSWCVALHLWLAGALMHGFARSLGARPEAAAVAAIGFMFSGATVGHLVYVSMTCTVVWLPGVWWGIEAGFRRRDGLPFLLAGAALGLALVAVHMQIAIYVALLGAAYGAARWLSMPGWRAAGALWLAAAFGLAGLLAAAQVLPMLELVGHTSRAASVDRALLTQYGLSPMWLMFLFAPRLFGHPTRGGQWANLTVPWEFAAYLGVATVVLALAAPLLVRRRAVAFLAAVWWGTFLLAWGRALPLFELLHGLPVLSSLRIPARWLVVGAAAGCALAGLAAEALARGAGDRRTAARLGFGLGWLLALLLVLGWLPVAAFRDLGRIDAAQVGRATACLAQMAALWIAASAAACAGWHGRRAWLRLAVPALLTIDLFLAHAGYNPVAPATEFAADALAERVADRLRPGERVYFPPYRGPRLLKPSTNLVVGVAALESFAPLKLRGVDGRVEAWRRELEPRPAASTRARWLAAARRAVVDHDAELARRRVLWLRRFGVALTLPEYGPPGAVPDADGLVTVPEPFPPAWDARSLRAVRHERITGCRVVLRGGGAAILGEAAHPGWWAYTAGGRAPVGAWRGVLQQVDAGPETRLVYQPMSFRLGLFAALVGWAILGTAWTLRRSA